MKIKADTWLEEYLERKSLFGKTKKIILLRLKQAIRNEKHLANEKINTLRKMAEIQIENNSLILLQELEVKESIYEQTRKEIIEFNQAEIEEKIKKMKEQVNKRIIKVKYVVDNDVRKIID